MEALGNQHAALRVCFNMAYCFQRLGELEESLKAFRKGREIEREISLALGEHNEADEKCAQIGELYLRLNDPENALKMFQLVSAKCMAGFYECKSSVEREH